MVSREPKVNHVHNRLSTLKTDLNVVEISIKMWKLYTVVNVVQVLHNLVENAHFLSFGNHLWRLRLSFHELE